MLANDADCVCLTVEVWSYMYFECLMCSTYVSRAGAVPIIMAAW